MRLLILLISLFQISSVFAQIDNIEIRQDDIKTVAIINIDSIGGNAMYHASFDIMKNHFSAVLIIKNDEDSDTTNIYMMSEIGMRLMWFTLYNNEISFVSAADFLNDEKTVKLFDRFFTSLLTTEYNKRKKVKINNADINYVQGRLLGKIVYHLKPFAKPYHNIKAEMFPKVIINLDLLQ